MVYSQVRQKLLFYVIVVMHYLLPIVIKKYVTFQTPIFCALNESGFGDDNTYFTFYIL